MRREKEVKRWRPVGIVLALVLSTSFGIFGMYGTDTVRGTIVGGHISVDTTWDLAGSPYLAMSDVFVDPGVTLTIEPGVEVKFDAGDPSPYLYMYVEGTLNATGTQASMIDFSVITPGLRHFWGGIHVELTGKAEVRYCNMSYAPPIVLKSSSRVNVTDNIFFFGTGAREWFETVTPGHHIANNTLLETTLLVNSSNNTVIDNTFEDGGFAIVGGYNLVQDNMLELTTIFMYSADYNLIYENKISARNEGGAIQIRDSHFNNITNNILSNSNGPGIYFTGAIGNTGNILSENIVSNVTDDCIYYWGRKGIIENNSLTDCNRGVVVTDDGNLIFGNHITNSTFGIRISVCDHNRIIKNNISYSSSYGLRLYISKNITIYHNNFIENAVQAVDDNSSGRFWDGGYPIGGNYWSDYSGFDNYSGPDQDEPGSDGFGDTPYFINGATRDRYPLMVPHTSILLRPPTGLNAILTGKDVENVTLRWALSKDDGMGFNTVVGYSIFRNSTYDSKGLGYGLIASLSNGTATHVDNLAGEGDPNDYFYHVCAINGTGNSSCSSNQVGKFTRQLSTGTNLVSIPLIQSDERIETVLQTLKYDKAWAYDSFEADWKWYMTFKPYKGELNTINHTIGFWVDVTEDSNLTVAGVVPFETTIYLRTGWNLVGFPSFDENYTVTDLKAAIPVDRAEGFDPTTQPYYLRKLQDSDALQAGQGYWIHVPTDVAWILSNT